MYVRYLYVRMQVPSTFLLLSYPFSIHIQYRARRRMQKTYIYLLHTGYTKNSQKNCSIRYFSFQHQYLFPSSLSNQKIRIFYMFFMYILYNQTMLPANTYNKHINEKELHRFMGQTCTRTFAVHYNTQKKKIEKKKHQTREPLQITRKTTKI